MKKRAEFLKEQGELEKTGFFPKYYIYNNVTQCVDDDCFVIDPKVSEADMEAVEFYAEFTDNKELSKCLQDWISAHRKRIGKPCFER